MLPILIELPASGEGVCFDNTYVSPCKRWTMARENGLTPAGNHVNGRWVLRRDGEWVDFDKYRSDLAERNRFKFDYDL